MFNLLRQIAASVLLALVVATAVVALVARESGRRVERTFVVHATGMGLRAIVRVLAETPAAEREARARSIARDVVAPLRIVRARAPRDGEPVTIEHPVGPPSLLFRLDDESAVRVDPPPAPLGPAPLFPALTLVGFVAVVVLTASALVGVPLVRRLNTIVRAVDELAKANFDDAVGAIAGPRDDAVGAVAAAIERSAKRLRRLFGEREELLQAVSHEIGTPLARIRFLLEALGSEADGEARQRALRAIEGEVTNLDELSSELISWVEADAAKLARTHFDPRASLAQLVEVASLSSERALDVALEAPDGASVGAFVEPRQFVRAIENLLRNAVRYANHRVIVRVSLAGEALDVSVEDDGPGISPEHRARVLEPFVRLDLERSRERGGAGLGLAIVRRIVERHDGTIAIGTSALGGASISTRWPSGPAGAR